MKIRDAVIAGQAGAWGRLADLMRARGATYHDVHGLVCRWHAEEGRRAPSLAEFDEKMQEAEEEAGR